MIDHNETACGQSAVRSARWDCLDALKLLACLLITNSHCRSIYPWYFLAIGGGHGNGLFFVISGFLLANIKLPFGEWMKKRVRRIVPMTLFFALIAVFLTEGLDYMRSLGFAKAVALIVNKYWFAVAIMLYYPIYYFIFASKARETAWLSFFVYVAGYFVLYMFAVDKTVFSIELEGFAPFKVYFYFGVMLAGGLLRRILERHAAMNSVKKTRVVSFLAALAAFVLWAAVYAMISLKGVGLSIQCLIHVGVMAFSVAMLVLASTFRRFRLPDSSPGRFVRLASASTLEIYLVQVTIQRYAEALPFPLSWAAFFIAAFAGGILVHTLADRLHI